NIGSHLIQESFEDLNAFNHEETVSKTKVKVFDLLKKTIRPEFLNRIDEIIMFQPLTREEVKQIVRIQFQSLQNLLKQNEMKITASEEAIEWLSQLGFDPQFGARPLKRVIQKKVLNELSKQILAGNITKDADIELKLNSKNEFEFVNIQKSVEV
ncbi:MAG: type VI secretion system ATPase TssH, partial [Bacteroidia bacterium]|nr:type VI secretion system ATPase TssH [Bacteroidia bacterium]